MSACDPKRTNISPKKSTKLPPFFIIERAIAGMATTMSFLEELKRRNVVKTATLYLVASWLVLQVADVLFDVLDLPSTWARLILAILILGFPITLIFSWVFELTPEGLKREKDVDRSQSITHLTGLKINILIIVLLLLAIAAVGVDRLMPEATTVADTPAIDESEDAAANGLQIDKSVAVLPFANRSLREEDRFFVDGIHDDILTQLARIDTLSVISRTSVERFRDTTQGMKEIGALLGVKHILEGGVQRAGDRVRINVQLIDVSTDEHLWAETYDRELSTANLFATQTEVATAVANALQATFSVEDATRASTLPTNNLEAWEAYQLGRHSLRSSESGSFEEALEYFRRALELDPDFALAHVGLARASFLRQFATDVSADSAMTTATEAAQRALALAPDLPEGLAMFGDLLKWRYEYAEAETYFLRALEIDPNSAAALESYAGLLPILGRNAEAIALSEKLVRLDPLNVDHHQSLAISLFAVGRFGDALARLDKALDVDPSSAFTHHEIGHILQALGRLDLALPWLEKALELEQDQWYHLLWLANAYAALGDAAEAQELIDEALQRSGRNHVGPLFAAGMRDLDRGEVDGASRLLEEAYAIDPKFMAAVTMLAEIDISNGDMGRARERIELALPELLGDEPVLENIDCSCSSVPLAAVLLRAGETDRAERLLDLSEEWNAGRPRQGNYGYGINDVEIHALRGDTAKALRALREAEQAGWRSSFWRYYRDFNPYLESIRDEPEFKAIFADIERDLAIQRKVLDANPEDLPLDRDAWKTALYPES